MQGDATLFLRRDGVEAQWKLITPILEAWSKSSGSEVFPYRAGSDGPEAADQLLTRSGHWWSMISDSFSGCEETPLISVGDSPTLA
jgi:glucose-6-phosphate 1-dehydrogenase